ncbi:MAG: hypothetical protein HYS13_21400 [Planctomycetia bacterium]|nr:hypothetical protein [Planctomycetia bacterium]
MGDVFFLNPDDRALAILNCLGIRTFADAPPDVLQAAFRHAADDVFAELTRRIDAFEAVGVETVLSTGKYKSLVHRVHSAGGIFGLLYVALRSPELACERVARRVQSKGHDVPREKIVERWRRSIENLTWFAARCDALWVFDNSDSDLRRSPLLLAEGGLGSVVIHHPDAVPQVTAALAHLTSKA